MYLPSNTNMTVPLWTFEIFIICPLFNIVNCLQTVSGRHPAAPDLTSRLNSLTGGVTDISRLDMEYITAQLTRPCAK